MKKEIKQEREILIEKYISKAIIKGVSRGKLMEMSAIGSEESNSKDIAVLCGTLETILMSAEPSQEPLVLSNVEFGIISRQVGMPGQEIASLTKNALFLPEVGYNEDTIGMLMATKIKTFILMNKVLEVAKNINFDQTAIRKVEEKVLSELASKKPSEQIKFMEELIKRMEEKSLVETSEKISTSLGR